MRLIWGCLLFFNVLLSQAQSKVFIGPQAGAQFSSIYIEHTLQTLFVTTDFLPGYHGGLMAKVFTYRRKSSFINVGLQLGLNYSLKGWRQTFLTDEPTYQIKLGYMQLPAEAIVYAGRKKTKYFFTLGVFLEQMMSATKDPDPDLENIGNGVDFYTYEKDRDNEFGYGGRVSSGLQRTFGFGTIHLDGFIMMNISNVFNPPSYSSGVPDLSNQYVVGFTVAYLIPFGKLDFY